MKVCLISSIASAVLAVVSPLAAAGCVKPAASLAGVTDPAAVPGGGSQDRTEGPAAYLSLSQAIALALSNNLSYRQAAADEKIAEARLIEAGAGRLPSMAAAYRYFHTQNAASFNIPVPTPGGLRFQDVQLSGRDVNSINATLEYALFSGGAVQAGIGQAAAGLAGAQGQLSARRAGVIRDTIDAYFQLSQWQRDASIADQAVASARQNAAIAGELFKAGAVAKADLLRQQLSLANARLADIQANNAAALANASLANLLNIDLSSRITTTEVLNGDGPTYTLTYVLNQARLRRPEIAVAQDAVAIAQDAIRAARAGYLPTVRISLQDASTKPDFENVPQPQLSETLSATWHLFDGGMTKGKLQEAGMQLEKANTSLQQLKNDVDLEVRRAYLSYGAARSRLEAARAAQASADENLRVGQIRFRAGAGTSLELADALLADTQARTQYVDALANLRVAIANLQRSAGLL